MMVSPSGVTTVVPTRGRGCGQIVGGYRSCGRPDGGLWRLAERLVRRRSRHTLRYLTRGRTPVGGCARPDQGHRYGPRQGGAWIGATSGGSESPGAVGGGGGSGTRPGSQTRPRSSIRSPGTSRRSARNHQAAPACRRSVTLTAVARDRHQAADRRMRPPTGRSRSVNIRILLYSISYMTGHRAAFAAARVADVGFAERLVLAGRVHNDYQGGKQ